MLEFVLLLVVCVYALSVLLVDSIQLFTRLLFLLSLSVDCCNS